MIETQDAPTKGYLFQAISHPQDDGYDPCTSGSVLIMFGFESDEPATTNITITPGLGEDGMPRLTFTRAATVAGATEITQTTTTIVP